MEVGSWSLVMKAVFLDRDGVLNDNSSGPPNLPEELRLLPGAAEAVRNLKEAGYGVFVVTNQGGVGLGYMTQEDLDLVHAKLVEEVEAVGGAFDDIAACVHKPRAGCECRKPKPGMILSLADRYGVDLAHSFMVGDRDSDIEAGQAAGVRTVYIGNPGTAPKGADYVAPTLKDAASWIIGGD